MIGPRFVPPRALVPVQTRPFNAETPLPALLEPLTPAELVYVRNHFDVPEADAARWRLRVGGTVAHPFEVSLEELRALPHHTVTLTLECAGNGRTLMDPLPPGVRWGLGAVSTVRFTGTPLAALLERAGLRPETVEVVFTGADRGEVAPGRTEPFARSLTVEQALHPDTLLAWALNGEPLTPDHGHPLRLVVPGMYGMASVKWLHHVEAVSHPFDGYYQDHYRYEAPGEEDAPLVTRMRVRALIVTPADGAQVDGPMEVRGIAWSGEAPVARVEVSGDGGESWAEAELKPAASAYVAARWRLRWTPPAAGAYTLLARATDAAGNTQPLEPPPNVRGYGNNSVQRVRVTVR
jgi:DMSO/TMAO reductase YedYZ molybdopterin-dependent catalytic subunit